MIMFCFYLIFADSPKFCGQDEPVARILELCILHIAMAEMTSKGTPHKIVINEVTILSQSPSYFKFDKRNI